MATDNWSYTAEGTAVTISDCKEANFELLSGLIGDSAGYFVENSVEVDPNSFFEISCTDCSTSKCPVITEIACLDEQM